MRFTLALTMLFLSAGQPNSQTQQAYLRLGQKALAEGNFKLAVTSLEKFCMNDSSNVNALWMLGYSFYHLNNHSRAISTYSRLIDLAPKDPGSAFYYRGRSRIFVAQTNTATLQDKEKFFAGAIADFSSAISLEPGEIRSYQNRGIAYQEYGKFKMSRSNQKFYDRKKAIAALNASIADFEYVSTQNPQRRDMTSLIERSKELLGKVR
ncbi:MAG: tetratricopeptide repeat protein [Mucilaginibacter polytrichastri]|nr:tetratricopeptide repeat protein [Mucilaginibacter polytrichastri]